MGWAEMSCMGWVTGWKWGRVGAGWVHCKCGLGRVGLGYPGHVGSLLSAPGSRRKGKATPPARRRRSRATSSNDVRRSRCASSSSPAPIYPPHHPLPCRSTRPARISPRRHPGRRELLPAGTRAGVARVPPHHLLGAASLVFYSVTK